ncbi:hypothetical protein [Saccharothrix sp. NRRL B-16348]|nr:hypothetical protein [Saccharothrix sp. NRRL B-16348]
MTRARRGNGRQRVTARPTTGPRPDALPSGRPSPRARTAAEAS